ncbi:MAG: hypothetical protein EZS28_008307 [Streblomastix strix]|uniref:Uncharacterized protein n=1 Tax=Streblomastix strix TaxID=222440 RepID=A0A5J4WPV0_9EUKA|nr:MAG: hypothetical protein EZS28_008307 [Streblomastix strix]
MAQKGALTVLLDFLGFEEQQIHSSLVKQLIRPIFMRTRKKDKEEGIQQFRQLLLQIESENESNMRNTEIKEQLMFIALTIFLVITTAELAKFHRANDISQSDAELKNWAIKSEELLNFSELEKLRDPDDLSTGIRQLIQKSGIDKKYSLTSIPSDKITTLLSKRISSSAADRFIHHSEVASTFRRYFDRNSNDCARKLIAGISRVTENELEEERECAEQLGLPGNNKSQATFQQCSPIKQRFGTYSPGGRSQPGGICGSIRRGYQLLLCPTSFIQCSPSN